MVFILTVSFEVSLLIAGFFPEGSPKEDISIEQQLYEIVRGKKFALNCLS